MIREREEQILRLHAKHCPQETVPQTNGHRSAGSLSISDDEVIELCRNAKNGLKFERLFYHGDLSEYADDDSRADQGLVSIMAFYTQDHEQLGKLLGPFQERYNLRHPALTSSHSFSAQVVQTAVEASTGTFLSSSTP